MVDAISSVVSDFVARKLDPHIDILEDVKPDLNIEKPLSDGVTVKPELHAEKSLSEDMKPEIKHETVIGKAIFSFFNDFEIFNGPFLIILHRLWLAIFQINGTMAHGPLSSKSLMKLTINMLKVKKNHKVLSRKQSPENRNRWSAKLVQNFRNNQAFHHRHQWTLCTWDRKQK